MMALREESKFVNIIQYLVVSREGLVLSRQAISTKRNSSTRSGEAPGNMRSHGINENVEVKCYFWQSLIRLEQIHRTKYNNSRIV